MTDQLTDDEDEVSAAPDSLICSPSRDSHLLSAGCSCHHLQTWMKWTGHSFDN